MGNSMAHTWLRQRGIYRRAVRTKANFLTQTKKSQFRPKKVIVWAHCWPFSGYIDFSSSGSSKLAFLRTARRYEPHILSIYGEYGPYIANTTAMSAIYWLQNFFFYVGYLLYLASNIAFTTYKENAHPPENGFSQALVSRFMVLEFIS